MPIANVDRDDWVKRPGRLGAGVRVAGALDLIAVTAFLALLCASRTIDTAIIRHLQHMQLRKDRKMGIGRRKLFTLFLGAC